MNWNQNKSVHLSKGCVWLFAVLLVVICLFSPRLLHILQDRILINGQSISQMYFELLAVEYICAAICLFALWRLFCLLCNISVGDVFIRENVRILRTLSWLSIAVGLVLLYGAVRCWIFLALLAAAAAFIGLILRVIKNVFAEAVQLKDEHDYTI